MPHKTGSELKRFDQDLAHRFAFGAARMAWEAPCAMTVHYEKKKS
jgi:hypothetical protein